MFLCSINAADVIEASRKQQHRQSYSVFQTMSSPEFLLSKDLLYQEVAKFDLFLAVLQARK